jgi:hypothetical protein
MPQFYGREIATGELAGLRCLIEVQKFADVCHLFWAANESPACDIPLFDKPFLAYIGLLRFYQQCGKTMIAPDLEPS